jgi:hypothetical protein
MEMAIRSRILALLLMVICCGSALAAPRDIAGVWQGKLQVDPTTALTIQFTFAKKADGSYSAVLNSPDNANIKNVAADTVSLQDTALKLQVASLSGSYSGTVKDATIDGQWQQQGQALPLVLTRYEQPHLSKAAIDTLAGTWNGPLTTPVGKLTFVFRFKPNAKGDLDGTLAVPEQGGREIPMSDIAFADNTLTFKIPLVVGDFKATYANGALNGTWKQGAPGFPANGMPVVLKKGEFRAPALALKLSNASFVALSGGWEGTLKVKTPQGQEVAVPLVLRFETNSEAQYVAYIDSPSQKATGIPVSEASLENGKFVMKIAAVGAEYRADFNGKTLTGQWTQGPLNNPLTMTKK